MTDGSKKNGEKARFPRLLAYPLLIIGAIAAILFGLGLSDIEPLADIAITSQRGSPAENWVMFLLVIWIAALLYAIHAFEHRTPVVEGQNVALVAVTAVLVLLFGMYGATAVAVLSTIGVVVMIVTQRAKLAALVAELDETAEDAIENKLASGDDEHHAAQKENNNG